ncbi:MAG: TetR/AcrR family transcriptional regulator [Acidobacteriota bacterium]
MGDPLRTRETILEAAERIIVHSGVEKATIDEVAREARISKGGVLHHFPSKEAIAVALLERLIEIFESDVNARQALDPDPVGSFTRAFLQVVNERTDNCSEVGYALKSGFRQSPALQKLAIAAHMRWQARVESDGLDPVRTSVVRLATDGLWLARVNRVAVPSEGLRKPLIEFLLSLTRSVSEPTRAPSHPVRKRSAKTNAL